MAKKENNNRNHQAYEAWGRRKTEMNADPMAKQFQKIWRIGCLRQRIAENRMTEKNKAEAIRVGI